MMSNKDDTSFRITQEQALAYTTPVSDHSQEKRKQLSSPISPEIVENKRPDYGVTIDDSMFSPNFMDDFARSICPTIAKMVSEQIEQSLSNIIQPIVNRAVLSAINDDSQLQTIIAKHVNTSLTPLTAHMKTQESEMKDLKSEISELKTALEDQQQYSRRTALKFHNVPIPRGDISNFDTHEAVINIARAINVTITRDDLSRSHILGGVRNGTTTVIARFVRYTDRHKIFLNKKLCKNMGNKIFITESLTKYRSSLVGRLNKLRHEKHIHSLWTMDGRIFYKSGENTEKILVKSEACVSALEANCRLRSHGNVSSPMASTSSASM